METRGFIQGNDGRFLRVLCTLPSLPAMGTTAEVPKKRRKHETLAHCVLLFLVFSPIMASKMRWNARTLFMHIRRNCNKLNAKKHVFFSAAPFQPGSVRPMAQNFLAAHHAHPGPPEMPAVSMLGVAAQLACPAHRSPTRTVVTDLFWALPLRPPLVRCKLRQRSFVPVGRGHFSILLSFCPLLPSLPLSTTVVTRSDGFFSSSPVVAFLFPLLPLLRG